MKAISKEMTVDKWLEALRESNVDSEGFSSRDLRREMGITEGTASKLLRRWSDRGMLVHAGYKYDTAIDGRTIRVPVYKPVRRAKKATRSSKK